MRTRIQRTSAQIGLLFAALFTTLSLAQDSAHPAISLGNTSVSHYLGKELQYALVEGRNVTISDILRKNSTISWQQSHSTPLFLGNRAQNAWLRLHLAPLPDGPGEWVLELMWPYYHLLELYSVDKKDGRVVKIEMALPLAGYLPYAFSLSMDQAMEKEVYIKLHNSAKLLLPLRIAPASVFIKDTLIRHILLGVLFGTLVVMCLYNMFLSIFTRDSSYTYYVVYVFSIILYTLDNTGVGLRYIWGGNHYIETHSFGLFSSFSFLAATLFIRRFLNLTRHGGWLLHISNIVALYWVVMVILYIFSAHHWLLTSEDYGAFLSCIIGLVTTIVCWIRGSISAKYLTIAWSVLILSTALLMMGLTGLLPFTQVIQNSQNVGFIIEVVLLSLALAERINRTRKAEEAAQKKILSMEREANLLLEKRVAQRTVDLKRAMDTLQLANRELGALSLQDELTKLANRRHFNIVFDQEFKRALRYEQPLSIILVDLDHFKEVNDTFGHQAGDHCLQHVSRILRIQAARAEDFVARFGGEEFVVILPGTPLKKAVQTAERMRKEIVTQPLRFADKDHTITASFGVAALPSKNYGSQTDLLGAADKALYLAKSGGRNRTEAAR